MRQLNWKISTVVVIALLAAVSGIRADGDGAAELTDEQKVEAKRLIAELGSRDCGYAERCI